MSLYHEAAEVLQEAYKGHGSLKSIVFGRKDRKCDSKTLFALSIEAAKWSEILSKVIEESDLLKSEKQLTPALALGLVHDLLLSKKGIKLPSNHGLSTAVSRHKARISAELTKARLRRGCATINDLRLLVDNANQDAHGQYPRWVRLNTLTTSLEKQLSSTFLGYEQCHQLEAVVTAPTSSQRLWIDEHVPNLIAVPPSLDVTGLQAYKDGKLIIQDKASCFPACLIDPSFCDGDIIDACAAPGNKTTHLAAIKAHAPGNLGHDSPSLNHGKIFACEKDDARSMTLKKMVKLAKADKMVHVLQKQDFLKLDPQSSKFQNVTALLLDPSCSGSGIIGRDERTVTIHLPSTASALPLGSSKKRKRGKDTTQLSAPAISVESNKQNDLDEQELDTSIMQGKLLEDRLAALSSFQLRIVKHAMSFPAATRITYSTCSTHDEENENVVVKALLSGIAKERGWRIMQRDQQVQGMKIWRQRGLAATVKRAIESHATNETGLYLNATQIADACIRCQKDSGEMTMGFFVAGFVRDPDISDGVTDAKFNVTNYITGEYEDSVSAGEEWNGFSDEGD